MTDERLLGGRGLGATTSQGPQRARGVGEAVPSTTLVGTQPVHLSKAYGAGASLVVQGLRIKPANARDTGSAPGRGRHLYRPAKPVSPRLP